MIIKSKRVWGESTFSPAALLIENGKVAKWLPYDSKADVDYNNHMIIPGLIDIHTHGGFGCDAIDTDEQGIKTWVKGVTKFGTTSLLVTTFSCSHQTQIKSIENVVNVVNDGYSGAEILGIYLEGPFLGTEYVGGMDIKYIINPDIDEYNSYHKVADGLIKICAVAPEKPGAAEFIDHLVKLNVIPTAAHTAATFEQINEANKHGLLNMTHTYNCMSPLKHRDPGCVGAAMLNDNLYAELICDNSMVSVPACKILAKMKGKEKLILVTDSLALQGMPPGIFDCGGFCAEVTQDGSVKEVGTGMYLGSTLGLNNILRIAVQLCEMDLETAINASSYNAARLLNIADKKGRILPGYDADIAVFDDDFNTIQTYCKGVSQL
ncbi:MAG TPA: N-acetylglucosamine-6-phosphate deacetylase [Erysipelotrichaceae bacterium]|jgi:N-acetylglucosamine-6-phosphate deacetylase|nr:N-acetylglucosamine-6-phosphate deacetylase [Erysipelotrichaceae bacterium]HQA85027.1 N-acetylglucosamine-6-phosphate deacetylase [Erysipelotrichaceae bacterium]